MAFFAESISNCLQTLLQDEEQADFTVVVDKEDIPCHRFILSACSTYFRSLLRSKANTLLDKRVFLRGVSAATFKDVRHILYTGEDILKNDNMTDIWLAAHQLQIDFLLQSCERFIAGRINWSNVCDIWQKAYDLKSHTLIKKCESFLNEKLSLENYYIVYSKARRLKMSQILKKVQEFMMKNFEMISKDVVSKLSFEGVLEIVESHDLVVKSEDEVLDLIFNWIECQPNDTASTRQEEFGHTTVSARQEELDHTTVSARQEELDHTTVSARQEELDHTTVSARQEELDHTTVSARQKELDHTTASKWQEELGQTLTEDNGIIKAEETENTKIQLGKEDHIADGKNCESDVDPKMLARNFLSRIYDNKLWSQCEGASMKSGDSLPLHIKVYPATSNANLLQKTVSKSFQVPFSSKTTESPMARQRVDKGEQLVTLLKAARVYLASPDCLRKFYSHPAMEDNQAAKDILSEAITNRSNYLRDGQTFLGALHRKCSDLVNVVVFSHDSGFYAISVADGKCFTFQQCPVFKHNVRFVFFNRQLYASGTEDPNYSRNKLCEFSYGSWRVVTEFDGRHPSLVTHDNFIQFFKPSSGEIFRIARAVSGRKSYNILWSATVSSPTKIECAISFEGMLLIFCSGSNEVQDAGGTVVYRVDPGSREPSRLKSFPGPAQNMICFRGENKTFLLQSNGGLWEIIKMSGDLEFIFILKLWSVYDIILYGAVAVNQALYIFASKPTSDFKENHCVTATNGRFRSILYYLDIEESDHCSNVVSAILPKSCLRSL